MSYLTQLGGAKLFKSLKLSPSKFLLFFLIFLIIKTILIKYCLNYLLEKFDSIYRINYYESFIIVMLISLLF